MLYIMLMDTMVYLALAPTRVPFVGVASWTGVLAIFQIPDTGTAIAPTHREK
jgi:hypothetical protein